MITDLSLAASLFSPLFVGLVFHGVCIKFDWLSRFAVAIDGGGELRGCRLFGDNKTYRGIIAVSAGSAVGYWLQSVAPELQPAALRHLPGVGVALLGAAVGAAAMLSELPNSLLKRQLGIAAGKPGRGLAAPFFYLYDQVDFLVGAWLVLLVWITPSLSLVVWSLMFVLVVHQIVSSLGALLGMRKSAR